MGVSSLRLSAYERPVAQFLEEPVPVPEEPRLLRRIAATEKGQLWAITVRDHYVDVQTSTGKYSLLMRFSDAIAEAEPTCGAQVHRSHWVAWAGVGSICRAEGKLRVCLHNGQLIPVSRNHRDKVEARFPHMAEVKCDAA